MQNIGRFTGVEYMKEFSFHSGNYIKVRFCDVHDYPELIGGIGEFIDSFEVEPLGVFFKLCLRWIEHDDLWFKQAYVCVEALEAFNTFGNDEWAIKNIEVDLTEEEVKGIIKIVADGIKRELEDNFLV